SATEQRDELATLHSITSSPPPCPGRGPPSVFCTLHPAVRGTVRFLQRHEHGRGRAPSFGGVAETSPLHETAGSESRLWIFDLVSRGAAERKAETSAPSLSGGRGQIGRFAS